MAAAGSIDRSGQDTRRWSRSLNISCTGRRGAMSSPPSEPSICHTSPAVKSTVRFLAWESPFAFAAFKRPL